MKQIKKTKTVEVIKQSDQEKLKNKIKRRVSVRSLPKVS